MTHHHQACLPQKSLWAAGSRGTGQRCAIGKGEYVTQETNLARRQSRPHLFSLPQSPLPAHLLTPDHLRPSPSYPADHVSTALHQTSPNVKNSLHGDTDVQNRLLDSAGEGGWFERIALKHDITICERDSQWRVPWRSRAPKAGALGQPQRGGVRRREGDSVHLWPIHADPWQRPSQHCRVTVLQLK